MDATLGGFQFNSADVTTVYDSLLVPRLFGPWAAALLDAAELRRDQAVLDVATGPGTVARAAARRVGPRGRVVATDISPHMLAIARSRGAEPDAAEIEYVESPAAPLLVAGESFDVATCQQGLQFFPERSAALDQMRAALRPGGRLAVAVWGRIEICPLYRGLHAALREVVPADLADRIVAPFSMPDPDDLLRAVEAAGFSDVRVESRTLPLVFEAGVDQAALALAATPLQAALAALPDQRRAALAAAARRHLAPLAASGDGAFRTTMVANLALAARA